MNHEPITAIVTSSDDVQFVVRTSGAARGYEQTYARTQTAAELALNSDFTRLSDLDAAPLLAPELVFAAPRIASPQERRAAFRIIDGGKKS